MQRENTKRRLFTNPRFLVIALVLAVVLAVAVGTLAWLRHMRSMQTVTLIRASDRYLLGSDGTNTTAVNLGSIDVSEPGSRFYAFGVKSGQPSYRLQLAYTTNIPFTYTIHRASRNVSADGYTGQHSEGGDTFYYDPAALPGGYLNLSGDGRTATNAKHEISFGDNTGTVSVQKYAEPVYWQSGDVNRLDNENYIDYFVLEVSWSVSLPNDKETDLIYLTVGAPAGGSQ